MDNLTKIDNSFDKTRDAMCDTAITIIRRLTNTETNVMIFLAGKCLSSSNRMNKASTAGTNIERAKSWNICMDSCGDEIPMNKRTSG